MEGFPVAINFHAPAVKELWPMSSIHSSYLFQVHRAAYNLAESLWLCCGRDMRHFALHDSWFRSVGRITSRVVKGILYISSASMLELLMTNVSSWGKYGVSVHKKNLGFPTPYRRM